MASHVVHEVRQRDRGRFVPSNKISILHVSCCTGFKGDATTHVVHSKSSRRYAERQRSYTKACAVLTVDDGLIRQVLPGRHVRLHVGFHNERQEVRSPAPRGLLLVLGELPALVINQLSCELTHGASRTGEPT